MPDANILAGGSGLNRTVTVTPAPNQNGTATITLTVSDGTFTATDTFTLTVSAVNDPPTMSNLADRSIAVNSNTGATALTIGDLETAAASLTLTKSSSNTALVPAANIVFGGSGTARTVTVTPAANTLGSATITVTVSDGLLSASDPFLLTVTGTAAETWRFTYFGTTANSGAAADTANPDGDPWTNANEYILGTNPSSADHGPLLAPARVGNNITLTFLANQAAGPGYTGLTRFYDVATTTNLTNSASWTGLAGYTNLVGANQSVTVTQPLSASPRFYRLRVRVE